MLIPKNNKSKLINALALVIGFIMIFYLGKTLIQMLGCDQDINKIVYKFISPELPSGPELKELYDIKFCILDKNNKCIEGTSLTKDDFRSIKLIKTKIIYGHEKKYSLKIIMRDIEKLKIITSKGSYEKKMGMYFNNVCIAAPSFYGSLDEHILNSPLWDDENEIIKVLGKNIIEDYKKSWKN